MSHFCGPQGLRLASESVHRVNNDEQVVASDCPTALSADGTVVVVVRL
jgi:hypothetical protein